MLRFSKVDSLLYGLNAPPFVGQVKRLENQREGGVVAAHPLNGGLEVEEAALLKAKSTDERQSGSRNSN